MIIEAGRQLISPDHVSYLIEMNHGEALALIRELTCQLEANTSNVGNLEWHTPIGDHVRFAVLPDRP